jgi:hypothetical protein
VNYCFSQWVTLSSPEALTQSVVLFSRNLLYPKCKSNGHSYSVLVDYGFDRAESDNNKYWLVKNREKNATNIYTGNSVGKSCVERVFAYKSLISLSPSVLRQNYEGVIMTLDSVTCLLR